MSEAKLLAFRVRQAVIWLRELGIRTANTARMDNATGVLYIPCSFYLGADIIRFRFPLTRLGRRFLRELHTHLLRGIASGTINEDDVRCLFIALSLPPVIYRYRTRLRRVTGLVRDKKLRKWIVWRRIHSTELMRKGIKERRRLIKRVG